MNITRRSFVKATTTAAIGASIIGTTGFRTMAQAISANDLFPIPPESTTDPLNYLTREHFVPFVDSVMSVRGTSGKAVSVRLTEALDLTNSANEKNGYVGVNYSLVFEPLKKANMPADTYHFEHETLGNFSLTILPVGQSGRSRQAIVNRISQKN